MKPRVFLSYSRSSPRSLEVREAIEQVLSAEGYDVFVDEFSLKPGDTWRREIRRALADCHAGIILLSDTALQRPWVIYEASILSFRRELDASFRFIPVLLENVERSTLEKHEHFSVHALNEIQHTQGRAPREVAVEIQGVLGPAMQRAGTKTLLDGLSDHIGLELSEVARPRLRAVAEKLGLLPPLWLPERAAFDAARALALAVITDGPSKAVMGVVEDLALTLGARKTWELIELVAPLWVQFEAAGRIPGIIQQQKSLPGCIALNGRHLPNFTGKMYVRRAYWPYRRVVLQLSGGASENVAEHLIHELRSAVSAMWNIEVHHVDDFLKKPRSEPLFAVLPPEVMNDQATLTRLCTEYPAVTFIVPTGTQCLLPGAAPPLIKPLPALVLEEEEAAWTGYHDARAILRNYSNPY